MGKWIQFLMAAILTVVVFGQDPSGMIFVPDEALDTSTCTSNRRQGDACCKSTCAVCGGPNCNIDGMGRSCCVTRIRASGRDCRFDPPPCRIPQLSPSPTFLADPDCETGIKALNLAGTREVCCASRCGTCGGSGCDSRPGGAISCCIGRIIRRGVSCDTNGPPCVLSSPTASPSITVSPSSSSASDADPLCENGILGSNARGTACCASSCGRCGGRMCAELPGGADSCCINRILRRAPSCSLSSAPCVPEATPSVSVSATMTATASMSAPVSPLLADPNCDTGISQSRPGGTVCCASSCGQCGGPMCANAPGGAGNCCVRRILRSGVSCDTALPPCVVASASPSPSVSPSISPSASTSPSSSASASSSPLTADPDCSTGIIATRSFGSVCCLSSCGVCGGADCGSRPGGVDGCCIPRIRRNAGSCLQGLPPCVIESPTPSPSVTPSVSASPSASPSESTSVTPSPASEDPNCDFGIVGNNPSFGRVCCQSQCGVCGGSMCGENPGGVDNCCIRRIVNSKPLCTRATAPCVLESRSRVCRLKGKQKLITPNISVSTCFCG